MNIEKIKNLFVLLAEKHIGEPMNKKEEVGSRAARLMYRYGFDCVIPGINLKVESELRKLLLAFRPMMDVLSDEPDPWIEISVGYIK